MHIGLIGRCRPGLSRRLPAMPALRVVQWATGGVGKAAIEGILRHPELALVGCWVHSADKHGKDVGDIVGTGPIGVRATTSAAEIFDLAADAVVYAPIVPHAEDVAEIGRASCRERV